MSTRLDRRAFVLGSLAGLGALGRRADPAAARTLVLIQLSGGHDGFSMLVPHAEDAYARARRATRVEASAVLRLDERVGLHPRLGGLRARFERGQLALVEGIGCPQPTRSHFRSLDTWHAGDTRGRSLGTGWIGRCIERLPDAPPHAVVHLGSRPPFALHSARRPPLILEPGLLRLTDPARSSALRAARELGATERACSGGAARVQAAMRDAQTSTEVLREALAASTPCVYPPQAFALKLRNAALLIHAELGVRVCSLELAGFDTHDDQRRRHDRLMAELDEGLSAFLADLERSAAGRETLVVVFSEFGRRLEENASGGTDHGSAGLALVLGTRVRGGLHGRPPSLEALEDGDPAYTTDFRSLYASCIAHVFGLEPASVLGAVHPALALV